MPTFSIGSLKIDELGGSLSLTAKDWLTISSANNSGVISRVSSNRAAECHRFYAYPLVPFNVPTDFVSKDDEQKRDYRLDDDRDCPRSSGTAVGDTRIDSGSSS